MSVTGPTAAADLSTLAGQRLLAIDPLLPAQPEPPAGCGTRFAVTDARGTATAIAGCDHWTDEPGSLSLTWGAARRFHLRPRIAGQEIRPALDQVIGQWRDHLAEVPESADEDSAAIVLWPSRDIEGILVLQRRGLCPQAVIAARTTGRELGTGAAPVSDVEIRRAGPADLEAVTRLGVELVRYDSYFGAVVERPDSQDGLRRAAAELLAEPEPWTWLAERNGVAVGLLAAEPPAVAAWIAPLARQSPVAYLQELCVASGERGSGIGALLVTRFHEEIEAAGIPLTLLHYGQANPLSVPFWSQQGYRPLWTSWEARPARSLR